jgi:two-component system, LuxR family, sensor histidine kinase DctS
VGGVAQTPKKTPADPSSADFRPTGGSSRATIGSMPVMIPKSLLALLPRTGAWFWRLPIVAITLLIACIGFSVWFGLHQEQTERRAALVSDTLWMEQNMRHQFENVENQLTQISYQFGSDIHSDRAQDKVRELLQGNSGLSAMLWLDSDGVMQSTLPASAVPVRTAADHPIGVLRARTLNRPYYTHPYPIADGTYAIEVIMPVFGANDFSGYVVGIFSLPRLLSLHVPWWFAERYRLSFTNEDGKAIASTTNADDLETNHAFGVTFDRMGGLGIEVDAYRTSTRLMPAVVVSVLIVFSIIIAWSLWMLRNRVLRLQETEIALRSEHAFRQAMENSTLIGLLALDLQGQITHVNAAFCRMLGYPGDTLLGLSAPFPFLPPDTPDLTCLAPSQSTTDTSPAMERRFLRADGIALDVLVYEAPLIDAHDHHAGWMCSVLDVTERKRAEALARDQQEQLEATARLVTMGEMASTLAHELNQPLSAITSYSAGCLNTLKAGRYDEGQFTDILGKINHQGQRAGQIIRRIYGFVRRSESRSEPMDINAAILEATGLLETETARRKVRLESTLGTHLPQIMGDRVMIEQVIVNLLRNGMDAMKQVPEGSRVLRIASEIREDGVCLRVTDSGTGIPPEITDRLFDSFFTTKPEGMGMGLKICRSVAEQHNGRLWFEPSPEGGTTFFLQLPVGGQDGLTT